ncbi:Putative aromatic prenyltransferase, DMATS-type [Colletotrichum destructivum]|uniref:Aromatic prenyltransferase, DMATS-type n=1 Tax=Colletotrichum destructivum TaxID=34406 RepID=A0AAX4I1T8_9PEZI|nr:Putative aromatic prenyltransferase, DMATS-type [Colletotrichum destructivum]
MTPLFEAAGGYSAADQKSQTEFFKAHIAAHLGPVPAEPYEAYNMPYIPSPIETSINLTTRGAPKVRFWTNLGKPLDRSHADRGAPDRDRESLMRITRANDGDTRWMECLMSSLFPLPAQLDELRAATGPVWPYSLFCFDLDGSQRTMRAYFPVVVTCVGRSRTEVCLEAALSLQPCGADLKPCLDLVAAYLRDNRYEAGLHMLGVDCVDPHKARLKVYMDVNSNSWNAVRDAMTLGGRLTDDHTLRGLEILQSIYPLMRDEPEGRDDDWSKPPTNPLVAFPGLQFGIEIVAGRAVPEIKIYALLLQWTDTTEKAEKNMHSMLRKLGHEWGHKERITPTRQAAVGDVIRGLGAVSFSYSQTKGAYASFYFDPPTDYDDRAKAEFRGLGKGGLW